MANAAHSPFDALGAARKLPSHTKTWLSGLTSGLVVAGVFNPMDRALYLSVVMDRPFLHPENFRHPWQGFTQTLLYRSLSQGLYFPLVDVCRGPCQRLLRQPADSLPVAFAAGTLAGSINGAALNGFNAIKYGAWSNTAAAPATTGVGYNSRPAASAPLSFAQAARGMWRLGGVGPFLRGVRPTIYRDTVFGAAFAGLKHIFADWETQWHQRSQRLPSERLNQSGAARQLSPVSSLVAASIACAASSPFNYARNIMYSTQPGLRSPSTLQCMRDLSRECRASSAPLSHLQNRLRLGWGVARVALGMAAGWELYVWVKMLLAVP